MQIDDEYTWPPALVSLFEERFSELRAYEEVRARIDALCRHDIAARINTPPNPYRSAWQATIDTATDLIGSLDLIGHHCTRLHEDEIASLIEHGLRPLSKALLAERIMRRVTAGDIAAEIAERLLAENEAEKRGRIGLLWFLFTRLPLTEEWGVKPLFNSWGGEALYNSHEHDPVTGPMLRRIGLPCIVQAAVPARIVNTNCSVGERAYRRFMHARHVSTSHDGEVEGYVEETISPERIQRIIRYGEPEFLQLSHCDKWEDFAPTAIDH